MSRSVFIRGKRHRVLYAVRSDGTRPAEDFLDQLRKGDWRRDPDHESGEPWPDEYQATDRTVLIEIIRNFADSGKPQVATQVNVLDDGVWEFKRASKRVSFYDTDGSGNCVTFAKIENIEDAHRGADDPMWKFPNFEDQLRLGHCFGKTGQYTTEEDIKTSIEVKEEDLGHDRVA